MKALPLHGVWCVCVPLWSILHRGPCIFYDYRRPSGNPTEDFTQAAGAVLRISAIPEFEKLYEEVCKTTASHIANVPHECFQNECWSSSSLNEMHYLLTRS